MQNKEIELNLERSSIKKKRGRSFFNDQRMKSFEHNLNNPMFIKGSGNPFLDLSSHPFEATSAATKKVAVNGHVKDFGTGLASLEEEELAVQSNRMRASLPKNLSKKTAEKEIVSAMVKLNQEGYEVPVSF